MTWQKKGQTDGFKLNTQIELVLILEKFIEIANKEAAANAPWLFARDFTLNMAKRHILPKLPSLPSPNNYSA